MSDPRSSNDIRLQQLAAHLKKEKYDCAVVQNYTAAVSRFLHYLNRNGVAVDCVQSSDIESYLTALRFCRRYRRRRGRISDGLRKLHRSAIHMLMRVVHGQWPISQPPTPEHEVLHSQIIGSYDAWMSDLRGLATETRSDRRAEAGRFLKWLRESGGKNKPDALTVAGDCQKFCVSSRFN